MTLNADRWMEIANRWMAYLNWKSIVISWMNWNCEWKFKIIPFLPKQNKTDVLLHWKKNYARHLLAGFWMLVFWHSSINFWNVNNIQMFHTPKPDVFVLTIRSFHCFYVGFVGKTVSYDAILCSSSGTQCWHL